jgi:UDP-2,3-diacylglucosamine hydrolase
MSLEKVRNKVYFISDAHLGSGDDSRERERQLCQWLGSIKDDCKTLMLLGDMFDFWFTYRHLVPRGHVRLLGKLAELADSGVEIHFFLGNHDMWMFDYLEKEIGAVMHAEPEVFAFDGKRFLVGHGDGLGNLDHGFNFIRRVFRSRLNQRLFALLPSSLTFPIAQRWSDSNKRKHARQDCLRYLGDEREGIVLYCKERLAKEHFDYCVFGHRHTPLVRQLDAAPNGNSSLYVNTGDWFVNRNYAIYNLEDHNLKLCDWGKE